MATSAAGGAAAGLAALAARSKRLDNSDKASTIASAASGIPSSNLGRGDNYFPPSNRVCRPAGIVSDEEILITEYPRLITFIRYDQEYGAKEIGRVHLPLTPPFDLITIF